MRGGPKCFMHFFPFFFFFRSCTARAPSHSGTDHQRSSERASIQLVDRCVQDQYANYSAIIFLLDFQTVPSTLGTLLENGA